MLSVFRERQLTTDRGTETEWTIYVGGPRGGYAYIVCEREEEALEAVRRYVLAGGRLDRG